MIEFYVYMSLYIYLQIRENGLAKSYRDIQINKESFLQCLKDEDYFRWRMSEDGSDHFGRAAKTMKVESFHRGYL